MTNQPPCVICGGRTSQHAQGLVLRDRPVTYLRCEMCGLVAAREPDWLDVAYSHAIAALDVGLLGRSIEMSNIVTALIRTERLGAGRFLDWAGGYGTLTRLMRDRGLNFLHHDPYCANIFAEGYEGSLADSYDMVTAIEVLEHLVDPVRSLQLVAEVADRLLVTTLLLPSPPPQPGEWWYYTPETGQHVTFYTPRSLAVLANRLDMNVLTLNQHVHMFHRVPVSALTRLILRRPRVADRIGAVEALLRPRLSLQQADMEETLTRSRRGDEDHGTGL